MTELTSVLTDFHADLSRAKHLLLLVKSFRQFGASDVPGEIGDGVVAWTESIELHSAARVVRTDLPLLSGSLLLYVTGRFEYFVRQVVQAIADQIASKSSNANELPAALRKELWERTLDVAKSPRRYGFELEEAEAMLVQLADNLRSAASPLSIQSEVLSITDSNMNSSVVAELLKRVGIKSAWEEMGKQSRLKVLFETRDDREASLQAKGRLDTLMADRNQIAHPTTATQFPDPDQVLADLEFLTALSTLIVELAQVHVATLQTTQTA